jgi:RNA polymerase sporulation-specific sigma factor
LGERLDAGEAIGYNNSEGNVLNITTEAVLVILSSQKLVEDDGVRIGLDFLRVEEYEEKADEEVVVEAKKGNGIALEYLINKYKNFVKAKARSYFLIGADREDIIQEGMIGLYKAIRDFKGNKLSSFRAFAELCITRQIITAIKTATRQKHIPLNSYVSLNKPIYDEDSDRTLLDVLSGTKVTDPEELMINREEYNDIEFKIGEILSELERRVLMLYLEGKSYQEIAVELKRHVKSIDNALQRVKRKLERYLQIRRV